MSHLAKRQVTQQPKSNSVLFKKICIYIAWENGPEKIHTIRCILKLNLLAKSVDQSFLAGAYGMICF